MGIRVLKESELEDVQRIYIRSFVKIYPEFIKPNFLGDRCDYTKSWLFMDKNNPIGFISVALNKRKDKEWILKTLFVVPEHRGCGVGKSLLDFAEVFIIKNGGLKLVIGPLINQYFSLGITVDSDEMTFFRKQGYLEEKSFGYNPLWMKIDLDKWKPPKRYYAILRKLSDEHIKLRVSDYDDRKKILEMTSVHFTDWYERLLKPNEKLKNQAPSIIAESHGLAAGFTGPLGIVDEGFGKLGAVGVSPVFRRKGIAFATVVRTCEWWIEKGAESGYLWTGTGNPAVELYEKIGFKSVEKYIVISKLLDIGLS